MKWREAVHRSGYRERDINMVHTELFKGLLHFYGTDDASPVSVAYRVSCGGYDRR